MLGVLDAGVQVVEYRRHAQIVRESGSDNGPEIGSGAIWIEIDGASCLESVARARCMAADVTGDADNVHCRTGGEFPECLNTQYAGFSQSVRSDQAEFVVLEHDAALLGMAARMVGPVIGLNSRVELDCLFVAHNAVIIDFRVL